MLKIFELGPLIHIPLYYWTRNSPSFSLSDGRASDMQARMKITLPHLAFLEWDDFHTCSRFTRSTIPEGKWQATCSPLNAINSNFISTPIWFISVAECYQPVNFYPFSSMNCMQIASWIFKKEMCVPLTLRSKTSLQKYTKMDYHWACWVCFWVIQLPNHKTKQ